MYAVNHPAPSLRCRAYDLYRRWMPHLLLAGVLLAAIVAVTVASVRSWNPTSGDPRACVYDAKELNQISNSETLQLGQRLRLPNGSTHQVRPGETLWSICEGSR